MENRVRVAEVELSPGENRITVSLLVLMLFKFKGRQIHERAEVRYFSGNDFEKWPITAPKNISVHSKIRIRFFSEILY